MQLLTHLGLDTGYNGKPLTVDPVAKAGLEHNSFTSQTPYIVKSPWFCDDLKASLSTVHIDHAIIPVRDLKAAAASRIRVQQAHGPEKADVLVPGGMWHTFNPDMQEAILGRQLANLIQVLVDQDIPITFLAFPKFVQDAQYLFTKLQWLLSQVSVPQFEEAFNNTSRPDWIHHFD